MSAARVLELALAHLTISVWALALGALISLPLGVYASRRVALERVVLGVASGIQTIPGLALLAVMVPALASLSAIGLTLPSIGPLPAVLGLTLYSVLPMLRNTVVGLREVDPAAKEAARGVGMSPREALLAVELPLAMPTIVAGVRTATVWTVGMATLATPVGASSLGDLIFAGLQTRDHASVLVGCAASAVLALALDGLIRAAEAGRRARRRALSVPALAALALALLYALAAPVVAALDGGPRPVRIGAKPFTEQYVLAEVLAREVEAAGEVPEVRRSLGSHVAFDALVAGELDLYVEYSGTVWSSLMPARARSGRPDRERVAREVERWLRREHGVMVIARLGFENAYALAVREEGGPPVTRLSELAPYAPRMTAGGDYELFGRAEWRAIRSTYGLAFAAERAMDPTLLYEAAGSGAVDVIGAYTTDGRIDAYALRVLEDDRGVIPPYDAILLGSADFVARAPELVRALAALEGSIDAAAMRAMNRAVDVDGRSPRDAARALAR